ncbi:DUF1127 domain-containing protein [Polaromonas sp.]|uniref:DUF1127 domain-containing protein n=1 Tax=Polaromonas sp. TaxID=1869339 RepID=UPI003C860D91
MLYKTVGFPFPALARGLAQMTRVLPRWPTQDRGLRRSRDELAQMSARELNDLGISRGDIPALLDEPVAWRRDRR